MLKKLFYLLLIAYIFCPITGLSGELDQDDNIHTIEYVVQNNTNSVAEMMDISIPLENIEKADFINIEEISPEIVDSISQGEGQLFNISFTIDQEQDVKPSDEIVVHLGHDPSQIIIPTEDKIIVSDEEVPVILTQSISPTCQLADTISELRTRVFIHFKDNWSGINPESDFYLEGNFSLEDFNLSVNKGEAILQFVFRPYQVGTFPIYIKGIEDLAGNQKSYYIGSYSVERIIYDKDNPPVLPDESFDVFSTNQLDHDVLKFGSKKTAILDSGYSIETLGLLASFAEDAALIKVEEFSPDIINNYSFLIVPSAGLVEAKNISNMKEKFTEYVERGGTLFILPQPTDDCYDIVPLKVEGVGYYQDKACYTMTALICNDNPAFAGLTGSEMEGTVDGVLTAWPENTEIWLKRIKNNYPALISYEHGEGKVIVSNYYSDYAYGQSQLKEGERRFIRDLISWGRDFSDLSAIFPGKSIEIDVPIYLEEKSQGLSANRVKLIVRDPDRKIIETKEYSKEVNPGEENLVQSFHFDDSNYKYSGPGQDNLGIWWINYELYQDDIRVQGEVEGERFVIKIEKEIEGKPEISAAIKPLVEDVLAGTKIPFEIILKNSSEHVQTVNCEIMSRLNNSNNPDFFQASGVLKEIETRTYTLAAGETQTDLVELDAEFAGVSNNISFNKNWWVFDFNDRDGNTLIREQRGIDVYLPAVNVKYSFNNLSNPGSKLFYSGNEVEMEVYLENRVFPSYPVDWSIEVLNPEGEIVYEKNGFDVLEAVIYQEHTFRIPDESTLNGNYQVKFDIETNGQSVMTTYDRSELRVNNLSIILDSIIFKDGFIECYIENMTSENIDYTLNYSLKTEDDQLINNGEIKDTVSGESSNMIQLSVDNLVNYFTSYYLNLDMGDYGSKIIEFTPYNIEISGIDNKKTKSKLINYDLIIVNKNIRTDDISLIINSEQLAEDYSFELPDLEKGQTVTLPVDLELKNNIAPGRYIVDFILKDKYSNMKEVGYSFIEVEETSFNVNVINDSTNNLWGVEIGNNEDEELVLDYRIALYDVYNKYKDEGDRINIVKQGSEAVDTGDKLKLSWELSSVKEGDYLVSYDINTEFGVSSRKGIDMITLAGNGVDLGINMGSNNYFRDEDIVTYLELQNNEQELLGDIDIFLKHLSVSSKGNRIDNWTTIYGEDSRRGYYQLPGNISNPAVLWSINKNSYGRIVSGDILDDELNEIVYIADNHLIIAKGRTGYILYEIALEELITDLSNINILLADINNEGKDEIILLNDTTILVFDCEGNLIWSKDDFTEVLTPLMTAVIDLDNDGAMEILTGSYLLKARDGQIIRDDVISGIPVDINNDGELNIVTNIAIYDSEFNILYNNNSGSVGNKIVVSDINLNENKEIIIQADNRIYVFDNQYSLIWSYTDLDINNANRFNVYTGNQSLITASWKLHNSEGYKLILLNNNGSVLWEKNFSDGLDHMICDINGDSDMDIVILEGSYLSAYNLISGELIWQEYLDPNSNFIFTDATGDHSTEIIVDLYGEGIACIANFNSEGPEIISLEDEMSSARYSGLPKLKSLVLDDGSLWFIGNSCISYYLPMTGEYDVIPIESKTSQLALLYNEGLIEIYDGRNSLYLGYIDPDTKSFTMVGAKNESMTIYEEYAVYGDKYYFVSHDQDNYSYFYERDLTTNEVRFLGGFTIYLEKIIGIVDDGENMLVNYPAQGGSILYRMNIDEMSGVPLVEIPTLESINTIKWADDNTVFLYSEMRNDPSVNYRIYRYNYNNNTADYSTSDFCEVLYQMGVNPNKYISFEPIDENNIYIISRDYDNYTYLPVNTPHLIRYNILTGYIERLTEIEEYAAISTITAEGDNLYFAYYQFDGDIYSFNKKTKILNKHSASQEIKDLILSLNLKPQKIIKGDSNNIFLLTESDNIMEVNVLGVKIIYDNNEYYLFEIDLATDNWKITTFNYDNEGDPFTFYSNRSSGGLVVLTSFMDNMVIDVENRMVYATGYGENNDGEFNNILVKHELGTNNYTVLDSGDDLWEDVYFDNNNGKLYYHCNGELRIYDSISGEISNEEELSGKVTDYGLFFLGTKNNSIYFYDFSHSDLFGNTTLNAYYPRVHVNIYKYSFEEKDFKLINHFYNESQYFYEAVSGETLKWRNLVFEEESLSLILSNGQEILQYDLSKEYEFTVRNNSIYEEQIFALNESIIAQKNISLELSPNTMEEIELIFDAAGESGIYEIQGLVYNENGQVITETSKRFSVGGDIPIITMSTDKKYYQPGEYANLATVIANQTENIYEGLEFRVELINEQGNSTIYEEKVSLMSLEEKIFNISELLQDEGNYIFTAFLFSDDGRKIFETYGEVTVTTPAVDIELEIPEKVGLDRFQVGIMIENTGLIDLELIINSDLFEESKRICLKAGQIEYLTEELQISETVDFNLNISGDISETISKEIIFAESAELEVFLADIVPDSISEIPFVLKNTGEVDGDIPVKITLYCEDEQLESEELSLYVETGSEIIYKYPVNINPGNYIVMYSTPYSDGEKEFQCVKTFNGEIDVDLDLLDYNRLELDISIENTGYERIRGEVTLSLGSIYQEYSVDINVGETDENTIILTGLPLEEGEYDIEINLYNNGELIVKNTESFIREEGIYTNPEIVLIEYPEDIEIPVGESRDVSIMVKNIGMSAGNTLVEFYADPLCAFSEIVELESKEEKEISFTIPVPEGYESGSYTAKAVIGDRLYSINYHVKGYKVHAEAYLDKKSYTEGETAVLTIDIENLSDISEIPLFVRVKHSDYDQVKEISLNTEQSLEFEIPAENFDEKIFYGIYLEEYDRSLFLDSLYIREGYIDFTFTTDRELYEPGDNLLMDVDIETEEPQWLIINGPGDFYNVEMVDSNKTYVIPLPEDLKTGTYILFAQFGDLILEQKINVLGTLAHFVSASLDKEIYENEDSFRVDVIYDCKNENIEGLMEIQLIKPDMTEETILFEKDIDLLYGENHFTYTVKISSEQNGIHWLRLILQRKDGYKITSNKIAFKVGNFELNNITVEKDVYSDIIQPVEGNVNLNGFGQGDLLLYLDESIIGKKSIEVDGFLSIPYTISADSLTAGLHTVSAKYIGEKGSRMVSTEFEYGSELADLYVAGIEINKERTAEDKLAIKVLIAKENSLPADNIPVVVKIEDEIIEEYIINGIEEGEIHEKMILWDTEEFIGDGEIIVEIDPDNKIVEYNRDNNIDSIKINIPGMPEIENIPEITNQETLIVSGNTVSEGFVMIYLDEKLLTTVHADESGMFISDEIILKQGKNKLKFRVRNQKLFESCLLEKEFFVDSIEPEIQILNIKEGQCFTEEILPQIRVEEANIESELYLINGMEWDRNTAVSEEGNYTLFVSVRDIAGNISEDTVSFVIDKAPPVIEISGVENGKYYNTDIIPRINIIEVNPDGTEIKLNGMPYDGEPISNESRYLLDISARDKAGYRTSKAVEFVIDKTAPVVDIKGVEDGYVYNKELVIEINIIEEHLLQQEILINGEEYQSGTVIDKFGENQLKVIAEDLAGNITEINYTFYIQTGVNLEMKNSLEKETCALIYNPSDDNSCRILVEILEEQGLMTNTTYTSTEFLEELGTGNESLYILMDGGNFIHNGQYDYHYWANIGMIRQLLEEKVLAGDNLLYIYGGSLDGGALLIQDLQNLIGVQYGGNLPDFGWNADLEDYAGIIIPADGRILNAELNTAKEYGKIVLNYEEDWHQYLGEINYPALIYNNFGSGEVYSLLFNPLLINPAGADERNLIKNISTDLLPESNDYFKTESQLTLRSEIENFEVNSVLIRHVVELPDCFTALEENGYIIDGDNMVQEFIIQAGETVQLKAHGITADNPGEYIILSKLYYYTNQEEWLLVDERILDCHVE